MWQLIFNLTMKIASWNINSIRTRLEQLITWLNESNPDIVLLQETKVLDENFPFEPIEDCGYNIVVHGQKSYNGVAILSKFPLEDIQIGFPGQKDPSQARYIEAVTNNLRVASVYVPNGQEVGHDKYHYKLKFLEDFFHYTNQLQGLNERVIIGGDYNIAPTDLDVYDAKKFQDRILASPLERRAWRKIIHSGWIDAVAAYLGTNDLNAETFYTWWDYRQGSWEQNRGLRIDHFLLTPQAADQIKTISVDTDLRGNIRPSDHAPLILELTQLIV
tara:strand:+ start:40910 stop:41731 length:822 start_codon:yes stop_codon:yes gene_type:complete